MVEDSLRKHGAGRSILADKHGKVIAGNKTLQSAADINLPVRVVETDGHELVVVQRTDLDLDDPNARELAIADNRSSQVGLEWDAAILSQLKDEGVNLDSMFTEKELRQILATIPVDASNVPDAQIDKAAELQEKWKVKRGDLWEIGRHKLLCGDATSAEDVSRVTGGAKPPLMVTDPPYGVEYEADWRVGSANEQGKLAGSRGKNLGSVVNDERANWTDAYKLFVGAVAYIWHASARVEVAANLIDAGFEIRSQIIWRKPNFVISRGHYHWQHEAAWYAVRKGHSAHWIGDRAQSTMWDIASMQPMGRSRDESDAATGHGTQKPLECMARPIRNHEGDVYDPFVGSGTTICAAEINKRTCYAIEIKPEYVSVCLERLTAMGLSSKLVKDAK